MNHKRRRVDEARGEAGRSEEKNGREERGRGRVRIAGSGGEGAPNRGSQKLQIGLASWNIMKRNGAADVLGFLERSGVEVAGLQEAENLDEGEVLRKGWSIRRSANKKAGVVWRRSLDRVFERTESKDSAVGVVLGQWAFLSSYPTNSWGPLEDYKRDLLEVRQLGEDLRRAGARANVLAIDGQIELDYGLPEGVTGADPEGGSGHGPIAGGGDGTYEERQFLLWETVVAIRGKCTNMVEGEREPTFRGRGVGQGQARILDYLVVDRRWSCRTTVRWEETGLSDHAAVIGLATPEGGLWRAKPWLGRSLVGWEPTDFQNERRYRIIAHQAARKLEENPAEPFMLDAMAEALVKAAESVEFTTKQKKNFAVAKPAELRQAEAGLRTCWGQELSARKREVRNLRRKYKANKLKAETEHRGSKGSARIQTVNCQGIATESRAAWKEELEKFSRRKFCREGATVSHARLLEVWKQRAEGEREVPEITTALMLEARARMKMGKSGGLRRLVAEQIRKLPWRAIQMLRSAFQTRLNTGEDMAPSWKELVVVLIPKANGPTCELGKCRAICMIEVLNKWYMAVLTLMAKEQTDAHNNKRGEEKSRLPQYGYQEGMMVDDIVGSLLGFLRTGSCWGKELEVHCAVLDVCQAFDHLTLELCSEALEHGGVSAKVTWAILRELQGNRCAARFQEVEAEGPCDFNRSIRTGGKESTGLWTLFVELWMGDLEERWARQEWGLTVQGGGLGREDGAQRTVQLFIWADNIIFVSGSKKNLALMLQDATQELGRRGMRWKESDMSYVTTARETVGAGEEERGRGEGESSDLVLRFGLEEMRIKRKQEIMCLGSLVTEDGCSKKLLGFRIRQAWKAYMADKKYFNCRGIGTKRKMERYAQRIQPVMAFGLGHGVWGLEMYHKLRGVEGRMLAGILNRKKGNTEEWPAFWRRVYREARVKFKEEGHTAIEERVLKLIWMRGNRASLVVGSDTAPALQQTVVSLRHGNSEWERMRTESIYALDPSRKEPQGKRRKTGRPRRNWDWVWSEGIAQRWWEIGGIDRTWPTFRRRALELLGMVLEEDRGDTRLDSGGRGRGRGGGEKEEGGDQEQRRETRKAHNREREPKWDFEGAKKSGKALVFLEGDNKLVTGWTRGDAPVYHKPYRKRVARLQNTLQRWHEMGLMPPAEGEDLIRHIFREDNTRADALVKGAKKYGGRGKWFQGNLQGQQIVAYRGQFDGGKDQNAVGVGWVLEGATTDNAGSYYWVSLAYGCRRLSPTTTVVEAELVGLEELMGALDSLLVKGYIVYGTDGEVTHWRG